MGRNEPCPCGSGKKYKKCCGVAGINIGGIPWSPVSNIDYLGLNRAIAYAGKIGKKREDFCREYVSCKQAALKRIERDQIEQTAAQGEKISCRKGCVNCCMQYLLGTLQECEAIAYYLYQHEEAMAGFMRAYPVWKNKVQQDETGYEVFKNAVEQRIGGGIKEAYIRDYKEANLRFMMLSPLCPFHNQERVCTIYEVRPWTCADQVATTPSEWCHPLTNTKNENPKLYVSELVPEEIPYFLHTKALNVMLVPLGVWEVLTSGYAWLSGIPGLENLEKEVMLDKEVQEVAARYLPT